MFMPASLIVSPYMGVPPSYRNLLVNPTPQGKVAELRLELNSSGGKKDRNYSTKKIALKKIVANMTMSNNDMISLFPDIVECMGIPSLEIKKMWVSEGKLLRSKGDKTDILRSGAFFTLSTTLG